MQFVSAANLVPHYTSWFFYGPTRSGKTTATSTFPKRLWVFQPAQEDSKFTLAGLEGIDICEIDGLNAMNEGIDFLEKRKLQAEPLWQKGDDDSLVKAEELFPWRTVSIESLNHYLDLITKELTDDGRFDMNRFQWGKIANHMNMLHARLKELPVHLVYVDLNQKPVYDDKGKLKQAGGPLSSSKTAMKLQAACNTICYFEAREAQPRNIYTAHFTKVGEYDAGTRFAKLRDMPKLSPFNFAEIAKRLGIDP